jgi:hypothetical protein
MPLPTAGASAAAAATSLSAIAAAAVRLLLLSPYSLLLALHVLFQLLDTEAPGASVADAIFSMRFSAILVKMWLLGCTGSLAQPALIVCSFFSIVLFSPQTSWNFCLFR